MKKVVLFTLLLVLSFVDTKAQTVDEIVDHYLESIGGKEKLRKLESLYIKSYTKMQGMDIPIEIYMDKDGRRLVKMTLQGKEITQLAFDGQTGWRTNFVNQKPEKLEKEASENIKKNAKEEFPNPFLDYKKKGYKLELLGKEEIEGVEAYKIKLTQHPTLKDGKEFPSESYYYFDVENHVPILSETIITEGPYKGKKVQQVFSDFQEVNGLYFPFSTTSKFENTVTQEIKIKSIDINKPIDKKLFEFHEVKDEKK